MSIEDDSVDEPDHIIRVAISRNGGEGIKGGSTVVIQVSSVYRPDVLNDVVNRVERLIGLTELVDSPLFDDGLDDDDDDDDDDEYGPSAKDPLFE